MVDGSARVLVVEDEQPMATALADGLAAEGFSVEVAADGTAGLRLARRRSFDLIVLDLLLPGVDGLRFCKLLRRGGDWTPVLVLTAKHGDGEESRALDPGADDFLTKPFSFLVLVARIRSLLRRRTKERRTTLAAGDLVLDPAEHRCWRGSTEIELTAREFALPECRLRHSRPARNERD